MQVSSQFSSFSSCHPAPSSAHSSAFQHVVCCQMRMTRITCSCSEVCPSSLCKAMLICSCWLPTLEYCTVWCGYSTCGSWLSKSRTPVPVVAPTTLCCVDLQNLQVLLNLFCSWVGFPIMQWSWTAIEDGIYLGVTLDIGKPIFCDTVILK